MDLILAKPVNWLYFKDFFDKGANRPYDARLC